MSQFWRKREVSKSYLKSISSAIKKTSKSDQNKELQFDLSFKPFLM